MGELGWMKKDGVDEERKTRCAWERGWCRRRRRKTAHCLKYKLIVQTTRRRLAVVRSGKTK